MHKTSPHKLSNRGPNRSWRLARHLAVASYTASLLATLCLYLLPFGKSIPLLLLEFGPRWLVALGFLPILVMPMAFKKRSIAALIAIASTLALIDMRLTGCVKPAPSDGAFRVGSYNTGGGFIPPTDLLLWYNDQRLDVLLMQELYKPELLEEVANSLGLNILCESRLCAITQHKVDGELLLDRRSLDGWGAYAARFQVCNEDTCWPLLNLHLATPRHAIEEVLGLESWGKAHRMLQIRELESSFASLATNDPRALVAGDFNMTQQSPVYRKFWGNWQNAFGAAGCGTGRTKFTRRLGVRIDHILAGSSWRVQGSRVHESLGGDHRPITAALTQNQG